MALKNRNKVLLISVIILLVMVFSWVFLRPDFLEILINNDGLPRNARNKGFIVAKNNPATFAIEVPEDWIRTDYQNIPGFLSVFSISSPDYKQQGIEEDDYGMLPVTLTSGAKLDISVRPPTENTPPEPSGEGIVKSTYNFGKYTSDYFTYTDKSLINAKMHAVLFEKDNVHYSVKFVYNPQTFIEGEAFFKKVLNTITIK